MHAYLPCFTHALLSLPVQWHLAPFPIPYTTLLVPCAIPLLLCLFNLPYILSILSPAFCLCFVALAFMLLALWLPLFPARLSMPLCAFLPAYLGYLLHYHPTCCSCTWLYTFPSCVFYTYLLLTLCMHTHPSKALAKESLLKNPLCACHHLLPFSPWRQEQLVHSQCMHELLGWDRSCFGAWAGTYHHHPLHKFGHAHARHATSLGRRDHQQQ